MKKLILSQLMAVSAVITLNIFASTDLVACDSNITSDQGLCHTFDNGSIALIDVAKVCVAAGFSAATYTINVAPNIVLGNGSFGELVGVAVISIVVGGILTPYLPKCFSSQAWSDCLQRWSYPSYSESEKISHLFSGGVEFETQSYIDALYSAIPKSSQPELYAFQEKAMCRKESTGFMLGQKHYLAVGHIRSVLFLGNPNVVTRYNVDTNGHNVTTTDRGLLGVMYDDFMASNNIEKITLAHKATDAAKHVWDDTWEGAQALNNLVDHFSSMVHGHSSFYSPATRTLACFSLESGMPTFGIFIDANKPVRSCSAQSRSSAENSVKSAEDS